MKLNDVELIAMDKTPDKFRILVESLFVGYTVDLPDIGKIRMANTIDGSISLIKIYDNDNIIGLPDMTLSELYSISQKITDDASSLMAANLALKNIRKIR